MRKLVLFAGILLIIVLDFLALDDITTGNETNLIGEYLALAFSIILAPILYLLWKRKL